MNYYPYSTSVNQGDFPEDFPPGNLTESQYRFVETIPPFHDIETALKAIHELEADIAFIEFQLKEYRERDPLFRPAFQDSRWAKAAVSKITIKYSQINWIKHWLKNQGVGSHRTLTNQMTQLMKQFEKVSATNKELIKEVNQLRMVSSNSINQIARFDRELSTQKRHSWYMWDLIIKKFDYCLRILSSFYRGDKDEIKYLMSYLRWIPHTVKIKPQFGDNPFPEMLPEKRETLRNAKPDDQMTEK